MNISLSSGKTMGNKSKLVEKLTDLKKMFIAENLLFCVREVKPPTLRAVS